MASKWQKYIDAFKDIDKVLEGIKNTAFKVQHIESIHKDRFDKCKECSSFDAKGDDCLAPGTQPCCSECGCSLSFKTRSLSSACPSGKWESITSEEIENKILNQIENNGETTN
tara:strand:+ start:2752 stop:3090 length:339 start_codon:yes stop_codon:yes gene_type:complete